MLFLRQTWNKSRIVINFDEWDYLNVDAKNSKPHNL